MTVTAPLAFVRISAERLRANNLLLRGMAIQPDYREWILNGKPPSRCPRGGEMKSPMPESTRKKMLFCLLALLLAVAFLLRVQQWGRFLVPDEDTIAEMTWSLNNDPLPVGMPPLPGYPPFFMYLNFLLSLIYRKLLLFLGFIHFDSEFLLSGFGRLFTMKAGRIIAAFFGTSLVYMTYRIGRDFYNESVGFLAALLVAVNPFMILNSHIFKSDILLSLLLAIVLFLLLKFLRSFEIRFLFWAGFFEGLAVAAKYNGAIQVLAIGVALGLGWKGMPGPARKKAFLSVAAGGLLGFAAGAPNWLFHPVGSAQAAYRYAVSQYSGFAFYEKPLPSYLLYAKDFLESFGWVFLVFLPLGIALALIRKNKYDLLILAYLAIYYLVQGKSNFYANRMLLPLLAAAAVLIAKTLLFDIPRLLADRAKAGPPFYFLIWGWALLFSGGLAVQNLRAFHLLRTTSTLDAAFFYRIHHIPQGFRFGRETFTPKFARDFGKWDLTDIAFQRFRGKNSLQFLSTGLLSEYILTRTQNQRIKTKLSRRLRTFRPFHRIHKKPFSPWDDDVTFWYQLRPDLASIPTEKKAVDLPRLFFPEPKNATVFLPLQPYEKSPCHGTAGDGFFGKWLYSRDKIEKLKFHLFGEKAPLEITVSVNGAARKCIGPKGWIDIEIGGIKPRRLYDDFVYSLEIVSAAKTPFCVAFKAVFGPEGGSTPSSGFGLPQGGEERIPELFSDLPYPEWTRVFYARTGIDLSLLVFVNRSVLFQNDGGKKRVGPIESGRFPLTKGKYLIKITGSPIFAGAPAKNGLKMKVSLAHKSGTEERNVRIAVPVSEGTREFPLEIGEPFVFAKIAWDGMRECNWMIENITLEPDYRACLTSSVATD